MKKIPTWKLSVKEWNAEEFKTQVGQLFDELNEVSVGGCCDFVAIWMAPGEVGLC